MAVRDRERLTAAHQRGPDDLGDRHRGVRERSLSYAEHLSYSEAPIEHGNDESLASSVPQVRQCCLSHARRTGDRHRTIAEGDPAAQLRRSDDAAGGRGPIPGTRCTSSTAAALSPAIPPTLTISCWAVSTALLPGRPDPIIKARISASVRASAPSRRSRSR